MVLSLGVLRGLSWGSIAEVSLQDERVVSEGTTGALQAKEQFMWGHWRQRGGGEPGGLEKPETVGGGEGGGRGRGMRPEDRGGWITLEL